MRVRFAILGVSLALAALALPHAAQAQARAAATPATSLPESVAPQREAGVAGIRVESTSAAPLALALQDKPNGPGPKLVILGGAAFFGGLLIGDGAGRAIAVGGLVVGLYGLYLWMK
ncbi:MAG: hypothetical protein ABIZ91_03885 [Gemmatimonadaceae bacterium]